MTEPKAKGPPQSGPHLQAVPDPLTAEERRSVAIAREWNLPVVGLRECLKIIDRLVSRVEQIEAQVGRLKRVAVAAKAFQDAYDLFRADEPTNIDGADVSLCKAIAALKPSDLA